VAKSKEKFSASIIVRTVVDIPLRAATLEDAVDEAKALSVGDVLSVKMGGSFNDFEKDIAGIHSSAWM
jgi:hypothetical protein